MVPICFCFVCVTYRTTCCFVILVTGVSTWSAAIRLSRGCPKVNEQDRSLPFICRPLLNSHVSWRKTTQRKKRGAATRGDAIVALNDV